MSTSHISDSSLVGQAIKELPWMTIGIVFVSLMVLILTESDSSQVAFALKLNNTDLKVMLAFDTSAPLKAFGTSVLTSFFVHENSKHLFANLPWLILSGTALQRCLSGWWVVLILTLGHAAALLGAAATHHWASAPPLALGMSGGVFSTCFAWLFWRFKYWSWFALVTAAGALLATDVNVFFSHAPAFIVGWACAKLFLRES